MEMITCRQQRLWAVGDRVEVKGRLYGVQNHFGYIRVALTLWMILIELLSI